jgi:putative copper export protein
LRIRRGVRYGSAATLGAFGLLALIAMVRASRRQALDDAWQALRKVAPVAVVFVAFIALAGGTLASKYESGNATPFYALGLMVLPLVLLARAWGAVGSSSRAARASRALLCGGAIASAAFMLLESLNPAYLEGFGL